MNLEFYKPRNETLKKYIEGYYFISEDKSAPSLRYFTFPNNFSIVSVLGYAEISTGKGFFHISNSLDNKIAADFVCRYTEPVEIIYENPLNEITLYFKPLGINQFLDNSLIFKSREIIDFIPFPDFYKIMELIFRENEREKQIEMLEKYWLSKFREKDLRLIYQILADVESDLKIDDIARKHNFTRQYINKIFSKNIGKTPSEYRRIKRFRNSIDEIKSTKNLTQLSHNNLFFDQAHFIKDFKALTHINPSSFFKNVDIEKTNVWLYI